jgi:hypothetical protein
VQKSTKHGDPLSLTATVAAVTYLARVLSPSSYVLPADDRKQKTVRPL